MFVTKYSAIEWSENVIGTNCLAIGWCEIVFGTKYSAFGWSENVFGTNCLAIGSVRICFGGGIVLLLSGVRM